MARFPCPLEWIFNEGDQILISSSNKLGIIKSVVAETTKVDLAGAKGIISVPWNEGREPTLSHKGRLHASICYFN